VKLREVSQGRVLGFDLESKPSAFWYERPTAEITAIAWKWTDEETVHVMARRSDGRFACNDGKRISHQKAFTRFAAVLTEASVVFGHNIRNFDLPLLNAGMLRKELPVLPAVVASDTLRDVPRRRDMSWSLENLCALYGIEVEGEGKRHMSIVDWERSNELTNSGVMKTLDRVVSDVLLQELLRQKLIDLGILGAPKVWRP